VHNAVAGDVQDSAQPLGRGGLVRCAQPTV